MNEALRLTALFIRDLLSYDEQLIRIGRLNYELDDLEAAYIGVDSLGAAQRLAKGETYDGDAEVMTYAHQWRAPVTISFYGTGAWGRATDFAVRIATQKALELQEQLGLSVYQASGLTDVKLLTGQQYGERIELQLNVQYAVSADVDTLRIDTERLDILTERGEING